MKELSEYHSDLIIKDYVSFARNCLRLLRNKHVLTFQDSLNLQFDKILFLENELIDFRCTVQDMREVDRILQMINSLKLLHFIILYSMRLGSAPPSESSAMEILNYILKCRDPLFNEISGNMVSLGGILSHFRENVAEDWNSMGPLIKDVHIVLSSGKGTKNDLLNTFFKYFGDSMLKIFDEEQYHFIIDKAKKGESISLKEALGSFQFILKKIQSFIYDDRSKSLRDQYREVIDKSTDQYLEYAKKMKGIVEHIEHNLRLFIKVEGELGGEEEKDACDLLVEDGAVSLLEQCIERKCADPGFSFLYCQVLEKFWINDANFQAFIRMCKVYVKLVEKRVKLNALNPKSLRLNYREIKDQEIYDTIRGFSNGVLGVPFCCKSPRSGIRKFDLFDSFDDLWRIEQILSSHLHTEMNLFFRDKPEIDVVRLVKSFFLAFQERMLFIPKEERKKLFHDVADFGSASVFQGFLVTLSRWFSTIAEKKGTPFTEVGLSISLYVSDIAVSLRLVNGICKVKSDQLIFIKKISSDPALGKIKKSLLSRCMIINIWKPSKLLRDKFFHPFYLAAFLLTRGKDVYFKKFRFSYLWDYALKDVHRFITSSENNMVLEGIENAKENILDPKQVIKDTAYSEIARSIGNLIWLHALTSLQRRAYESGYYFSKLERIPRPWNRFSKVDRIPELKERLLHRNLLRIKFWRFVVKMKVNCFQLDVTGASFLEKIEKEQLMELFVSLRQLLDFRKYCLSDMEQTFLHWQFSGQESEDRNLIKICHLLGKGETAGVLKILMKLPHCRKNRLILNIEKILTVIEG